MGAFLVVVGPPCGDDPAGVGEPVEQVFVEAFIAQATVEAFDEAVLHRFARRDVVPLDPVLVGPLEHGVRRELRPVVADHHAGTPSLADDAIELAGNADPGQGRVDDEGEAFAGEVVDDGQDAEASAVAQNVRYEVDGPTLVHPLRDRHRCSRSDRPLAPTASPDRQAFLAVEPEDALVVHVRPRSSQKDVQPPVAEPAAFVRQRLQLPA